MFISRFSATEYTQAPLCMLQLALIGFCQFMLTCVNVLYFFDYQLFLFNFLLLV